MTTGKIQKVPGGAVEIVTMPRTKKQLFATLDGLVETFGLKIAFDFINGVIDHNCGVLMTVPDIPEGDIRRTEKALAWELEWQSKYVDAITEDDIAFAKVVQDQRKLGAAVAQIHAM